MSNYADSGLDGLKGYQIQNSSYPTALTRTATTSSTSGTVASGKKMIIVQNIGNAAGVFNGETLAPTATVFMPRINIGTYPAIAFNATGTKFTIITGV